MCFQGHESNKHVRAMLVQVEVRINTCLGGTFSTQKIHCFSLLNAFLTGLTDWLIITTTP